MILLRGRLKKILGFAPRGTFPSKAFYSLNPIRRSNLVGHGQEPHTILYANYLQRIHPRMNLLFRNFILQKGFSTISRSSSVSSRRVGRLELFFAVSFSFGLTMGLLYYFDTPFFLSFLLYSTDLVSMQRRFIEKVEEFMTSGTDFKITLEGPFECNFYGGPMKIHNVRLERPAKEGIATAYALNVKELSVQLSAHHYYTGKGFIESLHAIGIRGALQRIGFDERPVWRIKPVPGDFELNRLSVEDVHIHVQYPEPFHSYDVRIFQGETGKLRKSYLMLDLLSADSLIGLFDSSLFSLATPKTGNKSLDAKLSSVRVFKLEDLNFHHIFTPTEADSGPLSWVEQAKVDLNVLLTLPESDSVGRKDLPSFEDLLAIWPSMSAKGRARTLLDPSNLGLEILFKLKNVKASISSEDPNVSFVSGLLLKQIIGYLNQHQPVIPLQTYLSLPTEHFQGILTFYDSQLSQLAGMALYKEFLQLMEQERRHLKNIKKVALWSYKNYFLGGGASSESTLPSTSTLRMNNKSSQHYSNLFILQQPSF